MSRLERFDLFLANINSSAVVIRRQILNDESSQAEAKTTSNLPSNTTGERHGLTAARQSMFDSLMGLQQLAMGPIEFWQQATINYQHLACLRWLLRFNILTHVPLHDTIAFRALSATAKVPEHQLRHIVRMAMTNGLFQETQPNLVAHSPLSRQLTDPLFLQTLLFLTETAAPTALKMAEMTTQFAGAEGTSETAHNIAMDTKLPFFPYLSKNPAIAARLGAGMKTLGSADETHMKHLLSLYPWDALPGGHVVDVGGSLGHASIAIAEACPSISCIVQDLPVVIEKAQSTPLPPGLDGRVKFVAHDFFQAQPAAVSGADVFLVRLILQNHPKPAAQKILANIAAVMKPSAVILINNSILSRPGSQPIGTRQEAMERAKDLFMLQAMNGAEREEDEFRELVEAVPELKVQEIKRAEGGALGAVIVGKVSS